MGSERKPGEHRPKMLRAEHRRRVAQMAAGGMSQDVIAAELQVAQSTISGDIHALERQWREEAIADINEAKARELARLDKIESDAWAEWEESKKPVQKLTRDGDVFEERKGGNVAFLDQVQKCIAQRRAILGLDAPKVSAAVNVDAMNPEQAFSHFWTEVEAWLLKDRRAVEALAEILRDNPEIREQVAVLVQQGQEGD